LGVCSDRINDLVMIGQDGGWRPPTEARLGRAPRSSRGRSDAYDQLALIVEALALDVPDADEVKPFWAAVLRYTNRGELPEILDPGGRNNTLWFQTAPAATGEVQQRFHLDIVVPREVAEERLQAALDAGGTLVSTDDVPAYWVLADKHGNKVCICTADGREPTS